MWLSARPPPNPHQTNRGPDSKKLMESEGKPDHSQDHSRPGHPDGEPSHVESPGLLLVGEVGVVQPVLVGDARREGLLYLGGAADARRARRRAVEAGLHRSRGTGFFAGRTRPVSASWLLPGQGQVRCFVFVALGVAFLRVFPVPAGFFFLGGHPPLLAAPAGGRRTRKDGLLPTCAGLQGLVYCSFGRGV